MSALRSGIASFSTGHPIGGEQELITLLREKFPKAKCIAVEDISGEASSCETKILVLDLFCRRLWGYVSNPRRSARVRGPQHSETAQTCNGSPQSPN